MDHPSTDSLLYARQRIFDRDLQPGGEELLYREWTFPNRAPDQFDPERATSRVLVNAFLRDPAPTFGASCPAFVNFTALTLARDLPFPPDRLVVEVLESVHVDSTVIEQVQRLKAQGFRIGLDDYTRPDADHPLIEQADIIKLECPAFTPAGLRHVIACLRRRRPDIQILVEKIETATELRHALDAGCDLLQGYRLHKPEPVVAACEGDVTQADIDAVRTAIRDDAHRRLRRLLRHRPSLAAHFARLAWHRDDSQPAYRPRCRRTLEMLGTTVLSQLLDFLEAAQPARCVTRMHGVRQAKSRSSVSVAISTRTIDAGC
ncbi:EAL and HDOD domain-containing protein [Salinisphaera sp. Q1T1-3]|uniref:EAL and HDOD domain-containing protein n=1 Tax=Salinisphaera sp. Q1T1-3 TaxID=2321229 RepID=UPI000E760558|nr:EAL domain-containing protein [Salinisphaera sp. Q1T1-3]RJS95146.1 EAL domain-containing protein [Salinisphaera sp. Q1T1-3]